MHIAGAELRFLDTQHDVMDDGDGCVGDGCDGDGNNPLAGSSVSTTTTPIITANTQSPPSQQQPPQPPSSSTTTSSSSPPLRVYNELRMCVEDMVMSCTHTLTNTVASRPQSAAQGQGLGPSAQGQGLGPSAQGQGLGEATTRATVSVVHVSVEETKVTFDERDNSSNNSNNSREQEDDNNHGDGIDIISTSPSPSSHQPRPPPPPPPPPHRLRSFDDACRRVLRYEPLLSFRTASEVGVEATATASHPAGGGYSGEGGHPRGGGEGGQDHGAINRPSVSSSMSTPQDRGTRASVHHSNRTLIEAPHVDVTITVTPTASHPHLPTPSINHSEVQGGSGNGPVGAHLATSRPHPHDRNAPIIPSLPPSTPTSTFSSSFSTSSTSNDDEGGGTTPSSPVAGAVTIIVAIQLQPLVCSLRIPRANRSLLLLLLLTIT